MGPATGRGWRRSGHLNPTVEVIVEESVSEIERADEDGDERTLVEEEVEVLDEDDDDEGDDGGSGEEEKAGEAGLQRKRTIRVVIRSRAFL